MIKSYEITLIIYSYTVTKVQYVVNPPFVKQFQ